MDSPTCTVLCIPATCTKRQLTCPLSHRGPVLRRHTELMILHRHPVRLLGTTSPVLHNVLRINTRHRASYCTALLRRVLYKMRCPHVRQRTWSSLPMSTVSPHDPHLHTRAGGAETAVGGQVVRRQHACGCWMPADSAADSHARGNQLARTRLPRVHPGASLARICSAAQALGQSGRMRSSPRAHVSSLLRAHSRLDTPNARAPCPAALPSAARGGSWAGARWLLGQQGHVHVCGLLARCGGREGPLHFPCSSSTNIRGSQARGFLRSCKNSCTVAKMLSRHASTLAAQAFRSAAASARPVAQRRLPAVTAGARFSASTVKGAETSSLTSAAAAIAVLGGGFVGVFRWVTAPEVLLSPVRVCLCARAWPCACAARLSGASSGLKQKGLRV